MGTLQYCTNMLTKQGTGVSKGSDLRIRQASKHRQQGGKQVLIKNEAVPTGKYQNLDKLAQASFESLQLGALVGQRVVH